MGRLIDTDKLEGYILTKHGESNKVLCSKSIADVPTAFDVEAVVKELKKESYVTKLLGSEVRYLNLAKVIEIVRRGGVK